MLHYNYQEPTVEGRFRYYGGHVSPTSIRCSKTSQYQASGFFSIVEYVVNKVFRRADRATIDDTECKRTTCTREFTASDFTNSTIIRFTNKGTGVYNIIYVYMNYISFHVSSNVIL